MEYLGFPVKIANPLEQIVAEARGKVVHETPAIKFVQFENEIYLIEKQPTSPQSPSFDSEPLH